MASREGGAALVWCPFPDLASAGAAVDRLLDEGLIACANLIEGMESRYVWRGERGCSREVGALIKTRGDLLAAAVARLEALHPYEAPAVVGWECGAAGAAMLDWLGDLARAGAGTGGGA